MSSANKDGLLQVHLDKYLPLWCCSQHSPLPPLRNVESVQLLTVEQAIGSNQNGNQASASGVRCAGLGVAPVGQLATGDGDGGTMVVGLLKTNDCGEMILEDITGKVKCEMNAHCAGNVAVALQESPYEVAVLLTEWQFITPANRKRCEGYLEVAGVDLLSNGSTQKLPSSTSHEICKVASLKLSTRSRHLSSRAKFDIVARVTAVGEVLRSGERHMFTAELKDEDDSPHHCGLIVQTPSLLFMSKVIALQESYLFTQVRGMIMNKDMETERRVLVTTAESVIHPYHYDIESQPPNRKRMKGEGAVSHDCNVHSNPHFISYQGVLTECISPDAGLYKLDSGIMLYMTDRHCIDGCRGFRPGASLQLHKVHAMKLLPPLQIASGFYCCSKSSVCVLRFSRSSLPFKPFLPQNKLCRLLKRYSSIDVAYLIHTYLSLRKRYSTETSYAIIKELAKVASLCPLAKDQLSEFFSSPHSCSFTRTQDHHGNQPVVAESIAVFSKVVRERVVAAGVGVKWSGSENHLVGSESSNALLLGHSQHLEWSYVTLTGSELPAQVLLGQLQCCGETGYLTIADDSGTLPVVCQMPQCTGSSQGNLLEAIGCTVLLFGLTVCVERKSTGLHQQSMDSTPLSFYISPQICLTIAQAPVKEEGGDDVYFQVLSKNCVVTTPLSEMRFNSQVKINKSLHSLKLEDKEDSSSCKTVDVALCFSDETFKWYSYIVNGGVYSLSSANSLPSMDELSQSNFLQVTSGMQLKFVQHVPLQQTVYDVSDLVDRVPLPGFIMECKSGEPADKRMCMEIFTMKVVIIEHDYRVHHSTILAPPTTATPLDADATTAPPTSAVTSRQLCNSETILALKVQSLIYPDTIMLYYGLKVGQPHPLGLLPGVIVTFHSMALRTSRSGNVYCEATASSSYTLHSLNGVSSCRSSPTGELTPQMLSLPSVHFSELTQSLLIGCLTRRVVCVQCRISSVQRVALYYKCLGCLCTIVDGVCMSACPQSRPTIKAEGRFILDDGSGEGQLYATNDIVRQAMGLSQRDWAELNEVVVGTGQLVYVKGHQNCPQSEAGKLPTRGKAMLSEFVARSSVHRALKIYCQPFVSSAELEGCVLGHRHQVRMGYSTLSLPRLQLRAIAVLELTGRIRTGLCSDLARQLITKLKHME